MPFLRTLPPLVVLLALAAWTWSPLGHLGYGLGDNARILGNATLSPGLHSLAWMTPPADIPGVSGKPLVNLTLLLDFHRTDSGPGTYLRTNGALHAFNALLLFLLARAVFATGRLRARFARSAMPLAFALSALWLVHPVTTATVAQLAHRDLLLATAGGLGALALHVAARHSRTPGALRLASVASACAGVLAHPAAALVLPATFILDRTLISGSWRRTARRHAAHWASFTLAMGVGVLLSVTAGSLGGLRLPALNEVPGHLESQFQALGLSARLALWPAPLVHDYGPQILAWTPMGLVWSLVACAVVVVSVIGFWRNHPWALAGLLGIGSLTPLTARDPLNAEPIAEPRMYLPAAGACAAAIVVVGAGVRRKGLVAALSGTLALAASQESRDRLEVFTTPDQLWRDTVQKAPGNPRAHERLGGLLEVAKQPDQAIRAYRRSLELQPINPGLWYNLGTALARKRRFGDAIDCFTKSLEIAHRTAAAALNNRGLAYLTLEDFSKAEADLLAALRLRPGHAATLLNLSFLYERRNEAGPAGARLREALASDPASRRAFLTLLRQVSGRPLSSADRALLFAAADRQAGDPEIQTRMAERLLSDQEPEEAHRLVARALGKDASFGPALRLRQRLPAVPAGGSALEVKDGTKPASRDPSASAGEARASPSHPASGP